MRRRLAELIGGEHVRALLALLACLGVAAAAGSVVTAAAHTVRDRHAGHRRAVARPRAFASCASLVAYGRHYLSLTHGIPETPLAPVANGSPAPVYAGAPTTTAAPGASQPGGSGTGGTAYSTTNNQEPGVDEPDVVKTDGSTIFAVSANRLYAVAVSGGAPHLVGSLDLGSAGYGSQVLLSGGHLFVISRPSFIGPLPLAGGRPGAPARPAAAPTGSAMIFPSPYYFGGQTTLTEVDVSDPAAMRVMSTLKVDGSFVDARQNGSTARLVISSAPRAIVSPALRDRASGYVPSWRFHSLRTGRRMAGPLARCRQVARPADFSGLGMLTILTIDLNRGLLSTSTDALMADAQVVYGSQTSLYLATERWIDPATPVARLPSSQTTQIDRFDATSADRTTFVASGEVPGYLLNQFSLSESGGYLRVASTSSPDWWDGSVPRIPSQSYVTVLATQGSQLVRVGQLSGLGTGQRIYSVRFVGDTAYVVTFRAVDPLYTIDLSDPTAPRVAGQLELEGYSSYLHPLDNGLLLGVGQDVGTGNEPSGAQLELFDVSDPRSPKLVQKVTLGQGSSSTVQYDHHAFLFWPATSLAVLPVQIYPVQVAPPPTPAPGGTSPGQPAPAQGSTDQFTGAIGFHIDRSGLSEVGRISHPASNGYTPPIARSLVIGDSLYTLSDAGILASNLDTLAPGTFVAFPAPQPPPPVSGAPGAR